MTGSSVSSMKMGIGANPKLLVRVRKGLPSSRFCVKRGKTHVAGFAKTAARCTLIHSFAAHLLETDYDICPVYELPGHTMRKPYER